MNTEDLMDLQNRINREKKPVVSAETVDIVLDDCLKEGDVLQHIRWATVRAGLPAIEVSVQQGRMLEALVRNARATDILEVGTLGGYSTYCLAKGAGLGGHVTSIEYEPAHATVAHSNLRMSGLHDRVDIIVGDAHDVMLQLARQSKNSYDFVFIDADKESNGDYLKLALDITRIGATIVVDNVIRDGRVIDPARADKLEFIKTVGELDRNGLIQASVVQTTGSKGWDGFVLASKL